MEAIASAMLNAKFDCPVKDTEESLWEHCVSEVSEDLVVIEYAACCPLRQRRPFRSRTTQRGSPEKFI